MARTIVIVDDAEDDLVLLQRLLKTARVTNPITVLRTGEEALDYLKGEGPFADREKHPIPIVLILDLKMPVADGFQVLEWIKGEPHLKQMLVIVLSGITELEDVKRAYRMGARTFWTKPCRLADLAEIMKAYKEYWLVDGPESFPEL